VGEAELAALDTEVTAWIDAGVAEAEASPLPDPATLTERVYD
jgi:TPP-dependent pyruvate/acetoin dehydrogenase alpha subunit